MWHDKIIGAVVCFGSGSARIIRSSCIFCFSASGTLHDNSYAFFAHDSSKSFLVAIMIFPSIFNASALKIEFCKSVMLFPRLKNCFGLSGRLAGHNLSPNPPAKIITSVNIRILPKFIVFLFQFVKNKIAKCLDSVHKGQFNSLCQKRNLRCIYASDSVQYPVSFCFKNYYNGLHIVR